MTKAELLNALHNVPDDAEILMADGAPIISAEHTVDWAATELGTVELNFVYLSDEVADWAV